MCGHGLDRAASGQGQVASTCECGNKPSGSIQCREFLGQLRTGQLLKKDNAPCSKSETYVFQFKINQAAAQSCLVREIIFFLQCSIWLEVCIHLTFRVVVNGTPNKWRSMARSFNDKNTHVYDRICTFSPTVVTTANGPYPSQAGRLRALESRAVSRKRKAGNDIIFAVFFGRDGCASQIIGETKGLDFRREQSCFNP